MASGERFVSGHRAVHQDDALSFGQEGLRHFQSDAAAAAFNESSVKKPI
jgi:hypothetical protein